MYINNKHLIKKKNLLAFSGGVDSTALFFILLNNNISFDIAIIDYNIREQSKEEVSYAKELALKFNKQCYIKKIKISTSNFEKCARELRYKYFEEIITKHNYDNLITAHQLNDKLEWFLMQFSKGAGLIELKGLKEFNTKTNYNLIRPILNYSKKDLFNFLDKNNIKYFIDQSNFDEKYKRNYFRKNFANKLLDEFSSGIKKSFSYLDMDIKSLDIRSIPKVKINKLEIFKSLNDDNKNIRIIDKSMKQRGYILSSNQRDEIIRQKEIIINNICISIYNNHIWLCPNSSRIMDKEFKELCRINKIPKKNRAYIKEINTNIPYIINLLDT